MPSWIPSSQVFISWFSPGFTENIFYHPIWLQQMVSEQFRNTNPPRSQQRAKGSSGGFCGHAGHFDAFSSVFKLVWPNHPTSLILEPCWSLSPQSNEGSPQNPAIPLTPLTRYFSSSPELAGFTIPPLVGSHPRCLLSQRLRWMDNWNRTPNCFGWTGSSCVPAPAAEERCRHRTQCLRQVSS